MADFTILTGDTLARTATRVKAVYIGRVGYTSNRGAAATPVFTFEEDPDTGMYSSAANVLDFASAGIQTFSISAVGGAGLVPQNIRIYSSTLATTAVGANTVVEQSFTISGLVSTDFVSLSMPNLAPAAGGLRPGVAIVGARVFAADTLNVSFGNFGSVSTTVGSIAVRILAVRTAT